VKELKQFLEQHGLGKYTQELAENAIGLDVLPDLSDSDLKEIGLPLGDRKRLLMAALQLEEPARRKSELTTSPKTEAERRQLTVMFCDLVGSTALSHQLDPEDLRDVNRAYQDACKAAIERYEGFVARYMGDGVLVYFGYPQAHEDDAERAIHSGLSVIDAMNELNETFSDKLEIELGVRVGIATDRKSVV
jgi:class 3 adenylate cyclase